MTILRLKILTIVILLSASNYGYAESNFDFFFKTDNKYKDVIVQEVISADTIIIENNFKNGEKIKLIGLKAPEAPKKEKVQRSEYGFEVKKKVTPYTSIEEKAFEFTNNYLKGKHVRLEFDAEKQNENFIPIAYVFFTEEDTLINAEILRQGYANLHIVQPNTKYADQLRQAYQEARREKRGLQGEY